MFEKEAEEYATRPILYGTHTWKDEEKAFKDGAEFGYNKAKEWQYVKDGLPKISGSYLVFTGGKPFILDYDTEAKDFGYWYLDVGDNLGVRDTIFETVAERDEDKVIAWKELPEPPKER